MSDFFRAFNRITKQSRRTTLAYRPQANGTAERMVQTLTGSMKMCVENEQQWDWDEYAERLVFGLNSPTDRVRENTPFYPHLRLAAAVDVGTYARARQPRFARRGADPAALPSAETLHGC